MDFGIQYALYGMAVVFAVIVIVIIYQFRLKERMHYPLANEQDLGIGRVALSRVGKYYEGPMTTSENFFNHRLGQIIAGANEDKRKQTIAFRDKFMSFYTFALKDSREKILVSCDANYLDKKYCTRQDKGAEIAIRSIGPFQDCGLIGELDGFTWYWGKLDKTTVSASDLERKNFEEVLEGAKYIRLAAHNSEANRILKEDLKNTRDLLDQERKHSAEIFAKYDRALGALKQHSLAEPEQNKMPGTFFPKVKEWFATPWQIVSAGVAYLVSPLIIGRMGSNIAPTSTAYATLVITIAGFFIIPFARKVFGRWL